jgi:hypothetical protein
MARRRRNPRLIPAALLAAALGSLIAPAARAEPIPRRQTGIGRRDGNLIVSVGLQDLFSPVERARLSSGFATRILIRVHLRREGAPDPVAVAFQRAEIVYDLWDERFRVRVTAGPGSERSIETTSIDQAIAAATALLRFPVAPLGVLQPGERYVVAVRGDLNPLSPELLAEVRGWLREPTGRERRPGAGGGGDSFFGSFVTVFVNPQIEDSERQIRFLSQTFGVPSS